MRAQPQKLALRVPLPFDFRLTVQKPAGWHWGTPYEVFEDGVLYTAVRVAGVARAVGLKVWEVRPPGRSAFSEVRVEISGPRLSPTALQKLLASRQRPGRASLPGHRRPQRTGG